MQGDLATSRMMCCSDMIESAQIVISSYVMALAKLHTAPLTVGMSSPVGSHVQSCTACTGSWQPTWLCRNGGMSTKKALQHCNRGLIQGKHK